MCADIVDWRERTRFSASILYHTDRPKNQEPHKTLTIPMRMGLRSVKPVTVSAGEIAERGSFVDLRGWFDEIVVLKAWGTNSSMDKVRSC